MLNGLIFMQTTDCAGNIAVTLRDLNSSNTKNKKDVCAFHTENNK